MHFSFPIKRLYSFRRIALMAAIIFVLVKFFWPSQNHPPAIPPKLVETALTKPQTLQKTVRLLGVIHPKHATVLIAKGTGVLDVLTVTGQKITKGMLIAKIDNPEIENNLVLSEAAEKIAKEQYDRFDSLRKSGYASAKEIEEKKQAWISAQKEGMQTKIALDNLRFYAPFDGIIGAFRKREGAQVNQGEAVVSVYDPGSLMVDVDIPCANLADIKEGQIAYVSNKKYTLTHFQKMLDEDTHMCPADIAIDCENCLLGSTIDVDLVAAEKQNTIMIPFQALFIKNGQSFVYVVNKGKVEMVAVTTGLQQKENLEIISGLKPEQEVIIKGQERLYPGLAVEIFRPTPIHPEKINT